VGDVALLCPKILITASTTATRAQMATASGMNQY
jgi:hypothetical protein